MKRFLCIFSLLPVMCFADIGLEDFLWASSDGNSTTPKSIQENDGGYVVKDKDGNEFWIDSLENPHCSFTSTDIKVYGDGNSIDEVVSEVYIGELDLGDCDE